MTKTVVSLEIDAALLANVRAEALDLTETVEEGVRRILTENARAREWAEANAAAIEDHNRRIAQYGAFGDDIRTW